MTTQPEALRLADDILKCHFGRTHTGQKAAAELRRLHAENEALRSELRIEQTISFRVQMQQYAAQRDELLEALQYAVTEYGRPGGPWNVPSDPGGWLERARAAIAKVKEGSA